MMQKWSVYSTIYCRRRAIFILKKGTHMDSQKFLKWVSAKIEGLAMGVFFHMQESGYERAKKKGASSGNARDPFFV